MEEEARLIWRATVAGPSGSDLVERSRALFEGDNGIDLDLPNRSADRKAPEFDGGR
ncbi:MAG: hypothetical protein ACOYM8_18230 [Caulobacterales bacterium]